MPLTATSVRPYGYVWKAVFMTSCLSDSRRVLVTTLVALALLAASCGGSGGDSGGEVFLEAAAASGDDPFTSSVADTPTAGEATEFTVVAQSSESGTTSVSGNTPGLYGGTRDLGSCDKEQLVEFLTSNADKGKAWAKVAGVDYADVASYVESLTPVVLRGDTRVTNHGFKNGRATPLQSVLQAGTAVLVDNHGVPRVKCNCGNPLLEPIATKVAPSYTGTAWPNFEPSNVQVIAASEEPMTNITIINIYGGDTFVVQVFPPDLSVPTTTSTTTVIDADEPSTTVRPPSASTTIGVQDEPTTTITAPVTTTTEAQCEFGCGGSPTTSSPATTTTVRPTTTTTKPTTTTTAPTTTTTTTAATTTTCVQGPVSCS